MTRTVVLVSLFTAACSVGEVSIPGQGPDGGGSGDGGGTQLACINKGTAGQAHIHSAGAGGGNKSGQACIVGGCHGTPLGNGAPQFTYAGTVYQLDGTTINPGANIRIVPPSNLPITVVADDAGNFNVGGITNPFPAHTDVSSCPSMQKMTGTLTVAGDGNCSGGTACHGAGGAAGTIKLN
jgi:hypothetical protein